MANNNFMNFDEVSIRFQMDYSDYYDLYLSEKAFPGYCFSNGLDTECLVAYIDFTDKDSYIGNAVFANTAYTYTSAVTSTDYYLYNIGSVGVDNGLVKFDKDAVSEDEFYKIYAESSVLVPSGTNLFLTKVSSNKDKKSALNNEIEYQGTDGAKFNGSYFQGYFQTECDKYKVLPTELEDCWHWEFVLSGTGTFFYIGTRAENKWWKYYGHYDDEVAQLDERECGDENNDKSHYVDTEDKYFADDYMFDSSQDDLLSYFSDDYLSSSATTDWTIDDIPVRDENGEDMGTNMLGNESEGYFDTDNKFLIFKHGKECVTVFNYNSADTYTYYYAKHPYNENLFLKMKHGKNCYTVFDEEKARHQTDSASTTSQSYAMFRDLYNNAFSLSVTPEGAVEYKYLTLDCDTILADETSATTHAYKILSEKTKDGLVTGDKFNVINVKVRKAGPEMMRIYIYVNGFLVLVGQEVPVFNFKDLDDMYEKQEAVPYNISLGGGTQGLKDVIYPDLYTAPCQPYILPLEKEFGQSTFNGNMRSFKFYSCDKEYMEVKSSYLWEINRFK